MLVNTKPNATKYYWELRVINADFEEAFYYFTTDFMFDEEWIHLSDHNYEYDLVLFKDDEDIDEEQSYGIWIYQTTEYEDCYYGTITFKIPKNKKYVQFDYSI